MEVMGYTKETVDNILKPKKLENPHKELIDCCKRKADIDWHNDGYYHQFRHLLEILGETETNQWINGNIDWLSDKKFNNIMVLHATMHKNLRQADVFDGENSGHMDMILYALMGMKDYTYNVMVSVLVDEDDIKKWQVVKKELAETKN